MATTTISRFDRLTAFKRISAAPTLALSITMLASLLAPLIMHEQVGGMWDAIGWGAGILFTAEFCARFFLAERRFEFLRNNLLDISIIALLAPVLLVHNALLLTIVATARALLLILEVGKDLRHFFKTRNFPYVVAVIVMAIIVCGSLEYQFEHGAAGSNIKSVGDGAWWAIVTIATVGYGDKYPVTVGGKIIATVLIILGMSFTGVVSAVFTSIILKRDEADAEREALASEERIKRAVREAMQVELAAIRNSTKL